MLLLWSSNLLIRLSALFLCTTVVKYDLLMKASELEEKLCQQISTSPLLWIYSVSTSVSVGLWDPTQIKPEQTINSLCWQRLLFVCFCCRSTKAGHMLQHVRTLHSHWIEKYVPLMFFTPNPKVWMIADDYILNSAKTFSAHSCQQ